MLSPEAIYHSGELGIMVVTAYQVIKAANRVMSVLKDFPPHKHVNGFIVYPEGYEPSQVEKLKV